MIVDPIEKLQNALQSQPFENAQFQSVIARRCEQLIEARAAMLRAMNPQEIQQYHAQRLKAWDVAETQKLIPSYVSDNQDLVRYIEALHVIFADAELISRGAKAFMLRSALTADMGHAFRLENVQEVGGRALSDEEDVIQRIKDWERQLRPMKNEIIEPAAGRHKKD